MPSGHDQLTGSDDFQDAEFGQHVHKRVQLFGVACDLDDEAVLGEVDGLGLEMAHQLENLRPGDRIGLQPDVEALITEEDRANSIDSQLNRAIEFLQNEEYAAEK